MSEISPPAISKQPNRNKKYILFLQKYTIWVFLVVLIIVMSIISPNFFTLGNLTSVLKNLTHMALLAFGLTFVFLGGGFDLSQGATLIFSATLTINLNPWGVLPFIGTIVLLLFIAFLIGSFNGYLIGIQQLNPFIVTLGSRSIVGGILFIQAAGMVVSAAVQGPILEFIGLSRVLEFLPAQTVFFLAIALACWFVIKYTPYARKILAVGSGIKVGKFSGLKVERLQMSTYIINALLAGFAGFLLGCQTLHMRPTLVWHYDFDAITACAVGGISLSGGKGNIMGTLSGVLFLGFINNSMILLGIPYTWQLILKGLILLFAIIADMQSKKSYGQ